MHFLLIPQILKVFFLSAAVKSLASDNAANRSSAVGTLEYLAG